MCCEIKLETLQRFIRPYWCAGPLGCWGSPRTAQPDPDPGRSSPGSWPRPVGSRPWSPPPARSEHCCPPPAERDAQMTGDMVTWTSRDLRWRKCGWGWPLWEWPPTPPAGGWGVGSTRKVKYDPRSSAPWDVELRGCHWTHKKYILKSQIFCIE